MLALMSVSALYGCGNKGSDALEDLRNFKLENISDYKAIGYGVMDESKSQTKGKKNSVDVKRKDDAEHGLGIACERGGTYEQSYCRSSEPFFLIGQLDDGTIEKLNFKSDKKTASIQIWSYSKYGDFIFFAPFDNNNGYNEDENGNRTYFCDARFLGGLVDYYVLSLKSGKIYDPKGAGIDDFYLYGIVEANDDGSLIAETKVVDDYGYATISENETGLVIKSINYLPGSIDKYGNRLTQYGIVEAGDQTLRPFSSYFEQAQEVDYNWLNDVIFYRDKYNRGDSYVFGENGRFIKVNGAGKYDDYMRNSKGGKINVNDVNSFDSYSLGGWRNAVKGYDYDKAYDLTNVSKEELLEYLPHLISDYHYYWTVTDNGDVVYSQSATGSNGGYEVYSKPSRIYTTSGIYDIVSEYAYLRDTSLISEKDWNWSLIFRGEGAYQLKEGSIYKYAFVDDSVSKLDLDGCIITSLHVDEEKHITIEGMDKDYQKFNGYLDLNDKISLTKYSNSVDVVLTPIN